MSGKMQQWLQLGATLFMICLISTGLSADAEAQDTGALKIKSIKPVPKLEKPDVVKHHNKQPEIGIARPDSDRQPERLYIDGTGRLKEIDPYRRLIVIGNDTWPLSPKVKFYLGDQVYNRMPPSFEAGRYVGYRLDPETDKVSDLWFYDDIRALIEDD